MTTCASPPALADLELHQFVDGDADTVVVTHLQSCPFCLARAMQLRRLQQRLKQRLFRADCPAPETLSAYKLHLLDPSGSVAVAAHLAVCPHCAGELADLTALDADTLRTFANRPLQLHNRLRITVAQWMNHMAGSVSSAGASLPGVQFAALRGSADAPFVFEDEEGNEISISLAEEQAGQPNHRLSGLVVRSAPAYAAEQEAEGVVFILQAGRRLGSAPIDDLGNFEVTLPASGDFDLIAALGDVEVHLPTLHLGNTRTS